MAETYFTLCLHCGIPPQFATYNWKNLQSLMDMSKQPACDSCTAEMSSGLLIV